MFFFSRVGMGPAWSLYLALLAVSVVLICSPAQAAGSSGAAAIVYSTFLGGDGTDVASAITAGSDGAVWVGGRSCAKDFPFGDLVNSSLHAVPFYGQPLSNGFSPSAEFTGAFDCSSPADYLVYQNTFLRCRNYSEITIARPSDVSTSLGPQDLYGSSPVCGDGVLYKVGANGQPLAASYFGGVGSERVTTMLVPKGDGKTPQSLWIAGEVCSPFGFFGQILFNNKTKGRCDGFVAKLNETNGEFQGYSIFGGDEQDLPAALAETTDGRIWVVGSTLSYPDFPRGDEYIGLPPQNLSTGAAAPLPLTFQVKPVTFKAWDVFVRQYSSEGELLFSTVLGKDFTDTAGAATAGANGTLWVGGKTCNSNLLSSNSLGPAADAPFQATYGEQCDGLLMRWSPQGRLNYLSFLGGNGEDRIWGMASDGAGGAWVVGSTMSTNFPMVATSQWPRNTKQSAFSGFLARLDAKGKLLYSTYLNGVGGEDLLRSVAVDSRGGLWLFGETNSSSLPLEISRPALQGGEGRPFGRAHHTFLAHGNATTGLLDFTFVFGGDDEDFSGGVTLASDGGVWLTGSTASQNFPTVGEGVVQRGHGKQGSGADQGLLDMFVSKVQAPLQLRLGAPWDSSLAAPVQAPGKALAPAVVAEIVGSGGVRATGLSMDCRVVFNDTAAAAANGWTIPFATVSGSQGACVFTDLRLLVPANATYQLRIEATLRFGVVLSAELEVRYRGCAPGEQRDRGGADYSCISCPRGSTSLTPDATECQFCDDKKLDCQGGGEVFVRSGFWHPSLDELQTTLCAPPVSLDCLQKRIYACRPADACGGGYLNGSATPISRGASNITLGGRNQGRRLAQIDPPGAETNSSAGGVGFCREGYSGPLCATCEGGYARTASGRCSKCRESSAATWLILVAVFLVVVGVASLLIYLPQRCAFDERDMADAFFRTLVNYFQFTGLYAALNVDWSSLLVGLFKVYGATSSGGIPWNDLECELGRMSNQTSVFYSRFLVTMMYPPIAALVALIILGGLYLTKRVSSFKHLYVGSVCAALYLLYPTITSSSLSIFHCQKLGSKWYLEGYTDVVCYKGRHLRWLLLGGLTSLGAYVVGIPLLLFYIVWRKRKAGDMCEEQRDVWRAFAFLLADIKEQYFYLEILGMLQKLVLVCITVFAFRDSLLQTLLGLLLIMAILLFRVLVNPYKQKSLYLADGCAYSVAFLTLYGSLYFRLPAVQEHDAKRALVTACLFVVNAALILGLVLLTGVGYYKRWQRQGTLKVMVEAVKSRGRSRRSLDREEAPSKEGGLRTGELSLEDRRVSLSEEKLGGRM